VSKKRRLTARNAIDLRGTLLACVFFSFVFAGVLQAAGTTASNFLKIPVGARASGMGEAYTSLADDASAIYWNPAGLSSLNSKEFFVSHNIWFQDIQHSYAAFALPLDINTFPRPFGKTTVGIAITYLGVDDMERRTSNTAASEGNFGASDMAVSLALSRNIASISGNPLSFGASLKFIRQTIDTYSANAVAADLGLLYPLTIGGLPFRLGAAAQNIGTPVKFIDESYPLPLTFKAGASCMPLAAYKIPLGLSGDIEFPNDNDMSWRLGTEYVALQLISFRLGYTSRNETISDNSLNNNPSNISTFTGFMAGLGLTIPLSRGHRSAKDIMTIDYAFVPYGELGETHRISMGIKW
jgi:hypothetical protein